MSTIAGYLMSWIGQFQRTEEANVRFVAMYFHPLDTRHGERDVGQPYGRASDDPTSRILNVAPVADLQSTRPDIIVQPDRPDQGAGPIENSVLATSFRVGPARSYGRAERRVIAPVRPAQKPSRMHGRV